MPFLVGVNLNQTEAKYGPGNSPWEPLHVVGSGGLSVVASVESNSTGTPALSVVAPAGVSFAGGVGAASAAVPDRSSRQIAEQTTTIRRMATPRIPAFAHSRSPDEATTRRYRTTRCLVSTGSSPATAPAIEQRRGNVDNPLVSRWEAIHRGVRVTSRRTHDARYRGAQERDRGRAQSGRLRRDDAAHPGLRHRRLRRG